MSTLKENIIKEILEINDERVLRSIQNLIHKVEDATKHIQINNQQKIAFEEPRKDHKKGDFHSADDLFND